MAVTMPPLYAWSLASAPEPQPLICDASRKYVCITEERADGLVAFDFAIGWPELSVELLLPRAAFDEFCTRNQVIRLEPRAEAPPPGDHPKETSE
jgi:phenol hydroxylase P0 protein